MNAYLTENQFFAPIAVVSQLITAKEIILESFENYQKRSFRNRCHIDSAQGPLTLSVPLTKGKHEKKPIKEVTISYDIDWRRQHLQSIKSSYGSSPYFEYLIDDIQDLYAIQHKYLFDLNTAVWEWIITFTELEIKMIFTDEYQHDIQDPLISDSRNKIKTNNYQEVEFACRTYAQVFDSEHGFIKNLSILDLLFCTGKASLTYLS